MKNFLIIALVLFVVSCAHNKNKENSYKVELNSFKDLKGCFLLYNMKTKVFDKVIGEDVCRERFSAFSSFKVPLAVIGFDSGVLKDKNTVFKWNGVKESRVEANHDHNAMTWMRDSIVWYSQRITSKLGKKRFQKYLTDFNYGNQDISEGLNTAWLTPPSKKGKGLRISAYEQVEFMNKLWTNALPASQRAMQLTQEITYLETSPKGFKLNGKTGSNFYDKERKFQIGWFISHIEKDNQEYIAVTNISDLKPYNGSDYGGARAKQITKNILSSEGLW